MAPRLPGQTSIIYLVFFSFVSKSLSGIERQKKLEKFAILTRKPWSHVRILIYRTWPILNQDLEQGKLMAAVNSRNRLKFAKISRKDLLRTKM